MPALVGIISELKSEICREKLKLMVGAIRHESSYNYGYYIDSKFPIHLGWTCHKESFADCMPIQNETQDIALFIAGEVFPESDTILALRRKGHAFIEGNASYLVHLYEELDNEFFFELNGWFSGVIIDWRKDRTYLFNDRYGMHRIFMHEGRKGLFFSSEAKALLRVLPETREFDLQGLGQFMTLGCTLGTKSLYRGIQVLPGGTLFEFTKNSLRRELCYFNREILEEQTHLPNSDYISQFAELLPRVTRKFIFSKRPVAMSLTGGIDSRMVIACLNSPAGSLPCYTFGSMYRETFDVKIARRVARECHQMHQALVLGNDFLAKLPSYLQKAVFLSDGYMGILGAGELYANSMARKIAPVRLTGNHGSELLRGVRAFKSRMPRGNIIDRDVHPILEEANNSFCELVRKSSATSFVVFVQAPHQYYGRLSIERSQVDLRTPFLDNDVVRLVYRANPTCDGLLLAHTVIARYNPALRAIPTDRGFLGPNGFVSNKWRRVFREAVFKAEYFSGTGAPDWFVRSNRLIKWMHLQDGFLGWHRFYNPRMWLSGYLKNYVYELLLSDHQLDSCPYINKKNLNVIINEHFQEKKNYTREIDMVLTLALAAKLFFHSNPVRIETKEL
jgi:asparagine synthase (glutamine-hydrolysing)